ncbi:MAG: helix-turn-helix domain-containing protein [Christensenellales bacterium]
MHVSFKAIGRNIRAARTELGITQEDAAERLKISQLHFGRLERGERPASLEMLAKIAGVFGVSLTSLLNGCLIGEGFEQRPSAGPESLGQRIASIPTAARPRLSG